MTPVPLSNPRGVGMWQVEGNRWLLTLIGTAGHFPPTDEAGFAQFAAELADPVVVETMRHAKPCSDIVSFKGTANRWRHFERAPLLPERFVVIGDAFCAFSPFYGQGMTVAARSALAMRDALRKHSTSPKRQRCLRRHGCWPRGKTRASWGNWFGIGCAVIQRTIQRPRTIDPAL